MLFSMLLYSFILISFDAEYISFFYYIMSRCNDILMKINHLDVVKTGRSQVDHILHTKNRVLTLVW